MSISSLRKLAWIMDVDLDVFNELEKKFSNFEKKNKADVSSLWNEITKSNKRINDVEEKAKTIPNSYRVTRASSGFQTYANN